MKLEASNTIQNKIDELEETLKKQVDSINEMDNSLKSINGNKMMVQNYINQITGAIQAYKESLRLFAEPVTEPEVHILEPVS